MAIVASLIGRRRYSLGDKFTQIPWGLVAIVCCLSLIGFAMLYSAAGGKLEPWAGKQMVRFSIGVVLMIWIATTPIRVWLRLAYVIYGIALALLVAVKLQGTVGMGAQRWLEFGTFRLQPSEVMKLALVLAVARFFDQRGSDHSGNYLQLTIPLLLLLMPVVLTAMQPDLGTSLIMIIASGAIVFAIGLSWWILGGGILLLLTAAPFAWQYLHDYQKARILVFLNPSRDPLGTGYNIIQSKIALGSGGIFGKGYMLGTQSHLNFLPEKQTDFIFTMLGEEFGILGCLLVLFLFSGLLWYGFHIVSRGTSRFARIVALGITTFIFLNLFINVAMVMGMIPAKGVPLPFLSYGGSSLVVTLIGIGLLMNCWIYREVRLGPGGVDD